MNLIPSEKPIQLCLNNLRICNAFENNSTEPTHRTNKNSFVFYCQPEWSNFPRANIESSFILCLNVFTKWTVPAVFIQKRSCFESATLEIVWAFATETSGSFNNNPNSPNTFWRSCERFHLDFGEDIYMYAFLNKWKRAPSEKIVKAYEGVRFDLLIV